MAVEVDPLVQEIYDRLNDNSKAWLHEKMVKAGLTLADLKTKPPKKPGLAPSLDLRVLNGQPKRFVKTRRNRTSQNDKNPPATAGKAVMGEAIREGKGTTAGPDTVRGEKLPAGKDLGKYITEQLGDGKELADFYLGILRSAGKEGLAKGVWLTHRLQAAQWLADRGWGKPKGDEEGKGAIQINIMDYSTAEVQQPKVISVSSSPTEPEFKGPTAPAVEEVKYVEAKETKEASPVLNEPKVEQLNEHFEIEVTD